MFDRIIKLAVTVIPPARTRKSSCPPRLIVPRRGAGRVCYFLATSAEAQRGQAALPGSHSTSGTKSARDLGGWQVARAGTGGGQGWWPAWPPADRSGHTHTHPSPRRSLSPRRCCGARLPWARLGSCPEPPRSSCLSTCAWPPGTRSSTPGCTSCFAGRWSGASTLASVPGPGRSPCNPSSPAGPRCSRARAGRRGQLWKDRAPCQHVPHLNFVLPVSRICLFGSPGARSAGWTVLVAGLCAVFRHPWGPSNSSLTPLSKASPLSPPPPHSEAPPNPRKGVGNAGMVSGGKQTCKPPLAEILQKWGTLTPSDPWIWPTYWGTVDSLWQPNLRRLCLEKVEWERPRDSLSCQNIISFGSEIVNYWSFLYQYSYPTVWQPSRTGGLRKPQEVGLASSSSPHFLYWVFPKHFTAWISWKPPYSP